VDAAGDLVARYLHGGGDADRLLAVMGGLLLREDQLWEARSTSYQIRLDSDACYAASGHQW
jgi:hypothetical protein